MCAFKVRYKSSDFEFEFLDESGNSVGPPIAYGFQWSPIPTNDSIFLLLWSSVLPESQVIRVTNDDGKTAGWLCTVSALTSVEHSYSDSPYFRLAAGLATQFLLEIEAVQVDLLSRERPSIDVFPSGSCVLIASKKLISEDVAKNPLNLLPLLHRHSFSTYVFGNQQTRTAGKFAKENLLNDGQNRKNLQLRIAPADLRFLSFANTLFAGPLSRDQDSAYTFFLYYQIVELLMEEVQRQKTIQFGRVLQSSAEDTTLLYELIQNIKDQTSEIGRITSLFQDYTKNEYQEINGLKAECLNLLEKLNRAFNGNNCASALYGVRNQLIHNMRRFSTDALSIMPLINEYLEVIVPNMLMTFGNPPKIQQTD